jgi:acetyl esterase/lipase
MPSDNHIQSNKTTNIIKMKKTISVLLFLVLALSVTAQTEQRSIKVTENIAYRTDVGPSTVLDMAEPLFGPQTNRPAILIIHGGGWSAGSKNDMVYRTLMVDYAMKGYVVCNMNYRLVQEAPLPACIEDVRCAIRWMKANAQRLGIDPQRIGTYGHSAGGHLSLMAGVAADSKSFADDKDPLKEFDCSVACAAGGAPPTEIGRAGEWANHTEWWPIGYIGKSKTPFLVLQGGEDPVVRPNLTEDWVVKMQRAGASVDYVKVHGDHGVAFDKQLEFTRPAMDAFYARHLKHDDPSVSFEQMKVPDFGGSGPHKAIAVREKSLSDFVVYRPMNMDAAMRVGRLGMFQTGEVKTEKLPVLVFCNGGCMDTSIGYENMLTDIASYGYVVVAIGELQMLAQHEKDQHTPSSMVQQALDWICQQADDPASPYYNKIDQEKIAAAGHSCGGAQVLANADDRRLKTYLILNAGMGKMTMADASAKSLKNLHGPILYLVGGTEDVAWKNAQMDYKAIKKVPVVLADNTKSGHGGTYEQPNGGANSRMVRAWLDWQLKGNTEQKAIFIDGDLKDYADWTIMHKNFK